MHNTLALSEYDNMCYYAMFQGIRPEKPNTEQDMADSKKFGYKQAVTINRRMLGENNERLDWNRSLQESFLRETYDEIMRS